MDSIISYLQKPLSLEGDDLSTEQEVRESNKDNVATTFVELFSKFFYKYRYATRMVTIHPNLDGLRPLLDYYLHDNVNGWPSAAIWMDAIQFHFDDEATVSSEKFDKNVEQAGRAALEELRAREHLGEREKEKGVVTSFPSPPGLRWEDVTIAFVSDNEIRVEAKGLAQQYEYDEIEFEDKRAGGKRKLWFVLRALAMLGGRATVDDLIPASKAESLVSKDIQLLRKILYKLTGIKGDPFYHTKKGGDYQTKFTLRDEQLGVLRRD